MNLLGIRAPIRRVHIIGGAGSGKTTLAKWFRDKCGIPCYDLDQIGWDAAGKVPLDQRMAAIDAILPQPAWATEGAFLWWTDPLLEHAEIIVWLDLPFPLNAYRMVKRHILADLRGNNPHAGYRNLFDFMSGVGRRHYMRRPLAPKAPDDDFAITRAATQQILARYSAKLVRCRSPRDVRMVQATIKAMQQL
jgi:adenylate kinase family enzyme